MSQEKERKKLDTTLETAELIEMATGRRALR
jgi:hypothetical protein